MTDSLQQRSGETFDAHTSYHRAASSYQTELWPSDADELPDRAPSGTTEPLRKNRLTSSRLRNRLVLADSMAILVGALVAFVWWMLVRPPTGQSLPGHLILFVASFPLWLGAVVAFKLFQARSVLQPAEELRRICSASALGAVLTVALGFAVGFDALSRSWVLSMAVAVAVALGSERWIARQYFSRLRRNGSISRRIAIIGTDTNAIHLMHSLQSDPSLGYKVVGFIGDEDIGDRGRCSWLGSLSDAGNILRANDCSGAIVSLPSVEIEQVNLLTRTLTDDGIHVALSTSLTDIDVSRLRPQSLDHRTVLYIEPTIRDGWRRRAKRAFDALGASVGLALATPVLVIAAIAIKLDSRGPIFFRQERVGLDGEPFSIIKLRTMTVGAEQQLEQLLDANESDGGLFKIAEDPRITRVGTLLRKWSIDEIPQFLNVIRGDMSVVGPRPALTREVDVWDDQTLERLRVLPGITGLWQVEGRATSSFDQYKRLDLFYVDNWSLAHDLVIVLRTVRAVVTRRGAI